MKIRQLMGLVCSIVGGIICLIAITPPAIWWGVVMGVCYIILGCFIYHWKWLDQE